MLSAELPQLALPSLERPDRSALVADVLARLSPPVAVTLAGHHLRTSPLELVRGLIGLGQQLLAGSPQARSLIGSTILVLTRTQAQDRLSVSLFESSAGPEAATLCELSFTGLLQQALQLWQAWDTRVAAALADPLLQEAWRAQSADTALLGPLALAWAGEASQHRFAPGEQDFASLFQVLTGEAFPFPELLARGQREAACLYAGPRPDPELPPSQRLLSWLAAAAGAETEAFMIGFEDSRLIWASQAAVSGYFEDFAGPAGSSDVWSPAPLLTRLAFFGKHRQQFRDGLGLVYGELSPRHEPIAAERIKRLNQVVQLEALDASVQLQIPANTTLSVGRDPACDLRLDDPGVGRRQAIFHNHHGVCSVEDAGSPSGTWINDSAVHAPTPLHEGDLLRLGSLVFAVTLPQRSRFTRQT